MILTPLSASISQFTDGDAVDTNSLGFLVIGTNGMPGQARIAKVDDAQRLHVDGSGVTQPVSIFETTQVLIRKAVDFTASQTAQSIWTPASGKKFVITDYEISFSAAGAITVYDGNTDNTTQRVCKWNGAANGGVVHPYKKPFVSSAADNILKYSTGTGAAGSLIFIGYEI